MLTVNQLIGFGAGGGRGQIQYVGGKIATKLGATSGNSTIALNSGLTGGIASSASPGDFVVAMFGTGSIADRTLAITDGTTDYTLIGSELYSNDGDDTNLRVAYKFIAADTATTFGPTGAAEDGGTMAVRVYRGVDPSNPLDVAAVTASATNQSSAAVNPPAITPVTAGAWIVVFGAGSVGGSPDGTYASSDLAAFLTATTSETQTSVGGVGHKSDWVSGEFDPAAWTGVGSNVDYSWAAVTIALRPA